MLARRVRASVRFRITRATGLVRNRWYDLLANLKRPVSVTLPSGSKMFLDLDDDRARWLLREGGTFNPESLRMWHALLGSERWDVVVDVGANYGEMVLAVPPRDGQTVVAVEPNPRVAACLARSIEDAGLPVSLCGSALADRLGSARLAIDPSSTGLSTIVSRPHDERSIEYLVPTTTLDDLLLAQLGLGGANDTTGLGNVLIKIDVEGAEDLVLRGARGVLAAASQVAIMVEVVHSETVSLVELAPDLSPAHLVTGVPDRFVDGEQARAGRSPVYEQDIILWRGRPGSGLSALVGGAAPTGGA